VPGFQSVIKEVANQTPAAKNVTRQQCRDTGVMQELDSSGFLTQVLGG
jgi:hypothetical protein